MTENDLLTISVQDLLERVALSQPDPGAGSVAALIAALGAALVAMAARASVGDWPEAGGVAAQAESLRQRLAPLADSNAVAYGAALQALESRGAGKVGDQDRELGASLDRAADVLARIAEGAADVAELGVATADRCRPELRPDATGAALLGDAASMVALALIEANLTTTRHDERVERVRSLTALAHAAVEQARATTESPR